MRRVWLALALALMLTILFFQLAFAHERRTVGKYDIEAGFLNEPTYVNSPNAIDFRVTNNQTNKPVGGLDSTVKAEIIFGASSMPVTLEPNPDEPGAYAGYFIPTRAGSYIFHFTGSIEGMPFDEQFESGPGRFEDPVETTAIQFPDKLASPADMAKQLKAAQDSAASAQLYGLLGTGIGILGLIVAAVALFRVPKAKEQDRPAEPVRQL